ncbi:MAG: PASTA domain-containing protein [Pseudonocardiaceae bacterium]
MRQTRDVLVVTLRSGDGEVVDREELVQVPDFRGMQALSAWLAGHDVGLLLAGPDPDSPAPLLHGVVRRQTPAPGRRLHRWDVVTVWVGDLPFGGVREPRQPILPRFPLAAAREWPGEQASDRP